MTAPQNIHLSKVNKNCLHRLFIEQATSMPPPGLPKPELNIEQLTLHEVRDILELGDLIFPIAAVLLQEWQDVVELGAGVGLDKPLQVGVDRLPGGDLLGRVVHTRDRLTTRKEKERLETSMGGGGCIAQRLHTCFSPSSPGFDYHNSQKSREKIIVNQRCWLEEGVQCLENVDRTHLVLSSGKSVLQKRLQSTKGILQLRVKAKAYQTKIQLWAFRTYLYHTLGHIDMT